MEKGERFNSISHIIGAVLALIGLVALVVSSVQQGDPWKTTSFSIYGASLLLLYTGSALYHSLRGRAKAVLHKIDHLSIYLLIAGSYTPLTLVTLRDSWGWPIFLTIWALAIIGIVLDLLPQKGNRILPVILYIVMGWLIVIAIKPLLRAFPLTGVVWLVAGGLFYTGGVAFYAFDERVRHFHGIWHLFVLAGSITQYVAIFFYVT